MKIILFAAILFGVIGCENGPKLEQRIEVKHYFDSTFEVLTEVWIYESGTVKSLEYYKSAIVKCYQVDSTKAVDYADGLKHFRLIKAFYNSKNICKP